MLAKQNKAIVKLDKSTAGTLKLTYSSIHNLLSIQSFSNFCFRIISLEFVPPASQYTLSHLQKKLDTLQDNTIIFTTAQFNLKNVK